MTYFDVARTPKGHEWAVEVVRPGEAMSRGIYSSELIALAITALRFLRHATRRGVWEVRVRPWPGPSLPRHVHHVRVDTESEGEVVANEIVDALTTTGRTDRLPQLDDAP